MCVFKNEESEIIKLKVCNTGGRLLPFCLRVWQGMHITIHYVSCQWQLDPTFPAADLKSQRLKKSVSMQQNTIKISKLLHSPTFAVFPVKVIFATSVALWMSVRPETGRLSSKTMAEAYQKL